MAKSSGGMSLYVCICEWHNSWVSNKTKILPPESYLARLWGVLYACFNIYVQNVKLLKGLYNRQKVITQCMTIFFFFFFLIFLVPNKTFHMLLPHFLSEIFSVFCVLDCYQGPTGHNQCVISIFLGYK